MHAILDGKTRTYIHPMSSVYIRSKSFVLVYFINVQQLSELVQSAAQRVLYYSGDRYTASSFS